MRTSDYTIIVPLPESERALLVHGYSGAVDVVANEVGAFLQEANGGCEVVPPGILPETVDQLRQRAYLTDKSPDAEQALMCRIAEAIHRRQRQHAGFLLIPTYDCQLQCPYCVQGQLHARDAEDGDGRIDEATVDAAFRGMKELEPEPDEGDRITLYGGEPLMAENREIVEYILRRANENGYAISATTNGVGLAQYRDLLGPGKIEWLQITLDGPQRTHDRRRIGPDGRGTFVAISENISLALERGVHISLRTNVDRENVDAIPELARFYHQRGWLENESFHCYCHVVFADASGSPVARLLSRFELMEELARQEQTHPELSCLERDFGLDDTWFGLLRPKGLPRLRPTFCSAHNGMYLFDPWGDIYACWDAVRTPEGKLGRYVPDLELDEEALERWHGRSIAKMPKCRACPYALLCGGGCAQHAFWQTGDLYEPDCADFPELFHRVAPLVYEQWLQRKDEGVAEIAAGSTHDGQRSDIAKAAHASEGTHARRA